MRPTRSDFTKASSHPSGHGFTHAQIKILGADPKKPWLADFIGREIPDETWEAFVRAGDKLRERNQIKTSSIPHGDLSKSPKKPSTESEWAAYRCHLSCQIGRDALGGKAEVPYGYTKLEYAVYNLLHAVEELSKIAMAGTEKPKA